MADRPFPCSAPSDASPQVYFRGISDYTFRQCSPSRRRQRTPLPARKTWASHSCSGHGGAGCCHPYIGSSSSIVRQLSSFAIAVCLLVVSTCPRTAPTLDMHSTRASFTAGSVRLHCRRPLGRRSLPLRPFSLGPRTLCLRMCSWCGAS
jgi:hypothetical protein